MARSNQSIWQYIINKVHSLNLSNTDEEPDFSSQSRVLGSMLDTEDQDFKMLDI